MAEGKIPGLGDVVKTVANLALYQQRVAEGKTSDGVIYLVLAERKVFFNGKDWTEGGGKIEYRTFLTGAVNNVGKAENLASLNAFLEGEALLYYPYVRGGVTHNLSLVEYIVVDGVYVFRFDYEDTTLRQILVEVNADGTADEDILIVEKIFDPKLIADSTNAPQTGAVYAALQEKQDTLVDGVTIKMVNGQSILGEGNLEIQGGVTKAELEEVEEVTAAALNDLNEKKADKEYVEDALKNMDTSSLASKEELEALRNEVITNEEIVASSLNDLEDRKADKEYVEDALGNLDIDIDTSTLVTKDEFTDVEEVWAASYNLLNQKISDVQQYIYDEAASRRQFDEAIAEIQSILLENESVVTAAWNQLNTRINALEAAQAQGE